MLHNLVLIAYLLTHKCYHTVLSFCYSNRNRITSEIALLAIVSQQRDIDCYSMLARKGGGGSDKSIRHAYNQRRLVYLSTYEKCPFLHAYCYIFICKVFLPYFVVICYFRTPCHMPEQ